MSEIAPAWTGQSERNAGAVSSGLFGKRVRSNQQPAPMMTEPLPIPTVSDQQARLRAVILELLERRAPGETICPSDAARALAGSGFRRLMPTVRAAAADLVAAGQIEVTQKGAVVDIAQARGPVRLRRRCG